MIPKTLKRYFEGFQFSEGFSSDLIWNMMSFVVFGASGLILSFIISIFYPANILGIFNINFAVLLIISHLSSGGVHYSVLFKVAESEDELERVRILTSSVFIVIIYAGLVNSLIYIFYQYLGFLYDSPADSVSLLFIIPANLFLVLNKVYLSYINSCRRMKLFAAANFFRGISLVLLLIVMVWLQFEGKFLIAVFGFSEFVLFMVLLIQTGKLKSGSFRKFVEISKSHMIYGYKSVIGAILFDINTKVDILLLGIFVSDSAVGIYSIPALMIEGFNQIPVVIRNLINPILTKNFQSQNTDELSIRIKWGIKKVYKYLVPIGILILIAYPFLVNILNLSIETLPSFYILLILMIGSLISIGYSPFIMIFNQTGKPVTQTLVYLSVFLINLVLNLLLIPFYGIYGAALATSFAFICTIIIIKYFARTRNRISI